MEVLEKTQGWKEEEFDVVLQFMRTILLKHGASLIYTNPTMFPQLQSLIHASLGIHSLLKRNPLTPDVINRDRILVPPNWDSWGKIRVLREGFDVELVSQGWSIDLDQPLRQPHANEKGGDHGALVPTNGAHEEAEEEEDPEGSAVRLYETNVQDPTSNALFQASRANHSTKLEVETVDTQSFLAEQLKYLDLLKQKNEQDKAAKTTGTRKADGESGLYITGRADAGSGSASGLDQHIGPVQFNMGGIQVDADDMVQRLKVCPDLPRGPSLAIRIYLPHYPLSIVHRGPFC
jgi:dynein light intermediate chain 1